MERDEHQRRMAEFRLHRASMIERSDLMNEQITETYTEWLVALRSVPTDTTAPRPQELDEIAEKLPTMIDGQFDLVARSLQVQAEAATLYARRWQDPTALVQTLRSDAEGLTNSASNLRTLAVMVEVRNAPRNAAGCPMQRGRASRSRQCFRRRSRTPSSPCS